MRTAFLIVYLVMAVLFRSWKYPIVISVPLAMLGGFVGLHVLHDWSVVDPYTLVQNLDIPTILGFIILTGVAVNNAILIVHQTLDIQRNKGLDPQRAICRAVETRVRPILMSALTSVGGMVPLVLLSGSGSELYRGLGAVVVEGLLISTASTLLLVTVVLSSTFEIFGLRSAEHIGADARASGLATT